MIPRLPLSAISNAPSAASPSPFEPASRTSFGSNTAAPEGFSTLSGDDYLAFPMVCLGAAGGITASAHVCTARWVALVECGLAGKLDDGRHHHDALLPVVQTGFAEPNPAVWKGVLHAQGRIATPDVRMPMANASTAAIDRCLAAIDRASS